MNDNAHVKYLLASSEFRSLSALEKATRLVKFHDISRRKAAQICGVSEPSVRRAVKRAGDGEFVPPCRRGCPTILTEVEDENVLSWIRDQSKSSNPPTEQEIEEYINKNRIASGKDAVSESFARYWYDGKKDILTKSYAKPLEPERLAAATDENIEAFFDRVEKELGPMMLYNRNLIYNFDETMVTCKEKAVKVITFREFVKDEGKLYKLQMGKEYEHTTVGITVSASGCSLPPLIILPTSELPGESIVELASLFSKCWVIGGATGWINMHAFEEWTKRFIVEVINT